MKKALLTISVAASSFALAFAQTTIIIGSGAQQGQVNGSALLSLLALAQALVNNLGIFAIGVAVLAFFWFLIRFIFKADDPSGRSDALKGMAFAVLALFVMVSIWGIIGLLGSITGVNQGGNIPIPGIPRPS
ncbi:MAG: hypothetical protein ACAH17_01190 [Candidatus Paceibacterota bacterium]